MPTISQLPPASTIGPTDLFAIVQSGVTLKATASLVLSFVQTSLALGTAAFVNVPIVPANGGTGVISPTAHAIPIAEGSSNFNFINLANGQLLIGSAGADPVNATLTAGTNISIVNAPGGITISGTGEAGFSWNVVAGAAQAMLSNNGYIPTRSSLVTLTLPVTSNIGDQIDIVGSGSGGWSIAQNAGQNIQFGSSTTTTGVSGSLSSSNANDSFYMICTVANTTWTIASGPQGNLTVV